MPKTHNSYKTRLYGIWRHIKSRCYGMSDKAYCYYGGRGITMYKKWRSDFLEFKKWALKSGYKQNLTIDRIDNQNGYFPFNCQWISHSENSKKAKKYSGSKNGMAKLVDGEVWLIKNILKEKKNGFIIYYKQIAKMFRVNEGTIRAINDGRTWNHVKT